MITIGSPEMLASASWLDVVITFSIVASFIYLLKRPIKSKKENTDQIDESSKN